MLQESRLLFRVLCFVELIQFLSTDFELHGDNSDRRENSLVVRPEQEYVADVVKKKHEEGLHSRINHIHAQLNHISVPAPKKRLE
jgi:hypothetical protein